MWSKFLIFLRWALIIIGAVIFGAAYSYDAYLKLSSEIDVIDAINITQAVQIVSVIVIAVSSIWQINSLVVAHRPKKKENVEKNSNFSVTVSPYDLERDYLSNKNWEIREGRFWRQEWFIPLNLSTQENDLSVFEDERYVILGEPGSGKSTLLRHHMTLSANAYLKDRFNNPFPLLINLGNDGNPEEMNQLVNEWWEKHKLPYDFEYYLNSDKFILYLDGLNEMSGNKEKKVQIIREFIESNPRLRVIVTCRNVSYDLENLQLGLPLKYIEPLSENQRNTFIYKRVRESQTYLIASIESNSNLNIISNNPRNLSILSRLYNYTHEVPESINKIYEMYVNFLYDEYSKDKIRRHITGVERNNLNKNLQELAFRMIVENKGTSVRKRWANRIIGKDKLDIALAVGILVEKLNSIEFDHQTLQSYFALPKFLDHLAGRSTNYVVSCLLLIVVSPLILIISPFIIIFAILFYYENQGRLRKLPLIMRRILTFSMGYIEIFNPLLRVYYNFVWSHMIPGVGFIQKLGDLGSEAKSAIPILENILYHNNDSIKKDDIARAAAFISLMKIKYSEKDYDEALEMLVNSLQDKDMYYYAIEFIDGLPNGSQYVLEPRVEEIICIILTYLGKHIDDNRKYTKVMTQPIMESKVAKHIFYFSESSPDYLDILIIRTLFKLTTLQRGVLWHEYVRMMSNLEQNSLNLMSFFLVSELSDRDGLMCLDISVEIANNIGLKFLELMRLQNFVCAWPVNYVLRFIHINCGIPIYNLGDINFIVETIELVIFNENFKDGKAHRSILMLLTTIDLLISDLYDKNLLAIVNDIVSSKMLSEEEKYDIAQTFKYLSNDLAKEFSSF